MSNAHGIPTMYNGIQMRSRAEARWAAFFDEMGWAWQYEPVDLDGYIPDFYLLGRGGAKPCVVEVKGGILEPEGLKEISARIHPSVDLLLPAAPNLRQDNYAQLGSARYGDRGIGDWVSAGLHCCHSDHCRFKGATWGKIHADGSLIDARWDDPKARFFLETGADDAPGADGCLLCGGPLGRDCSSFAPRRQWANACNRTQWGSPLWKVSY